MLIPFKYLILFPIQVKGIIHIGAHELEELNQYLGKNIRRIIWIEANPQKYDFLKKKLSYYEQMDLGEFAAGSSEKKLTLNISNNGESSSFLELGTHKYSYPKINYVSKEEVDVIPVDKWIQKNKKSRRNYNFINIDIQGYELEALKGMKKQLSFADYVYLEVNYDEVYKKCPRLKDIDLFLRKFKFKRVGMLKTNQGWGDAIYTKKFVLLNRVYYAIMVPIVELLNMPKKISVYFQNNF